MSWYLNTNICKFYAAVDENDFVNTCKKLTSLDLRASLRKISKLGRTTEVRWFIEWYEDTIQITNKKNIFNSKKLI